MSEIRRWVTKAICPLALFAVLNCDTRLKAADDPYRPPAIRTENVPAVSAELVQTLHRYNNTRSASFSGWAPNGDGVLVETRFGNTTQLHRVTEPGGRREQLTFFDEPVSGRFLPNDEHGSLLISMGSGGNESYQVYLMDRESHEVKLLTDGTSRNLLGPVRDDGLFAVVASNKRNGRDTDLYEFDPRDSTSMRMVLETTGEYWTPEDWSPDGTTLLIKHYVSINESYPALLDVASGKLMPIPVPGGGLKNGGEKVAYGAMKFAPDGKSIYLTSDANGEFLQLARVDLESFEYTWLTKDIPWDVEDVAVSAGPGLLPGANLLAFVVNEGGASGLYLLLNDVHRRIEIPAGIVGSLEFSPDGAQLGFTFSAADRPSDVYSVNLLNGKFSRWTYSELGGLDPATLVAPALIAFKTFDGRTIPAWIYRPAGATAEKSAAVVVNIHGGPESQYRPYFSSLDQFLVNELGVAVVRPNVRGSRGYGKSYLLLDNGEKREDSVRDIGALLDWIAEQPELDGQRVAVMGGSYGGYMVLGSLVHFSDRLKAGIDAVGIASFKTFLENTSPYRQDLRRAEYGDERDPKMAAFFKKIDPVNNTGKIRTALLVAHGENDPRVPFSEAEQIAPKVRANGQIVWTVYANNEGHGFRKKENADYLTAVIVQFLKDQLGVGR